MKDLNQTALQSAHQHSEYRDENTPEKYRVRVEAGLPIVEAALGREKQGLFVTLELSDEEQINRDCASEYLNEVDLLEHPEDYMNL